MPLKKSYPAYPRLPPAGPNVAVNERIELFIETERERYIILLEILS